MDKEIDDLINSIKDLELIKRINELETIIDSDDSIMENFKELTDIQKKMINSKYYSKQNAYLEYEKEYNLIKEKISNTVFVDEYLELLDEAYQLLKDIIGIIESGINKEL